MFVLFVLGTAVPVGWLQLGGATILLGLGGWRLWRTRHPIWVGMRVGFWDLTCWSWIMASAHGAGVMLIPLLLGATCGQTLTGKGNLTFSSSPFAAGAVLVHTVSHLVVSGILAWLVYDCIGLAVLRRSWFNVDLIWSFSLLMGGALLLFTTVTAIRWVIAGRNRPGEAGSVSCQADSVWIAGQIELVPADNDT